MMRSLYWNRKGGVTMTHRVYFDMTACLLNLVVIIPPGEIALPEPDA
jgi:hypothetical protein